jgi:hypothetical protein
MKQTAVEWLVEKLSYSTTDGTIISHHKIITNLVEQAKKMEREEIIDAYLKGYLEDIPNPSSMQYYEPLAEQYYNETYESKPRI